MFKRLTSIVIVCCIMMFGTMSHVSANFVGRVYKQAVDRVTFTKDLFEGKYSANNLYTRSLKIVKDREIVSTSSAFSQLSDYYRNCPGVGENDFINILSHSNPSFKITFDALLGDNVVWPTKEEIDGSYKKFFSCQSITTPSVTDYERVQNTINKLYYETYVSEHRIQSLSHDNFGSDIFWNGSLDDSDFDVLYDIQQVGKILFDQFKENPEILFYRLPSVGGGSSASLSAQSASMLGPQSGLTPSLTSSPPPSGNNTGNNNASDFDQHLDLDFPSQLGFDVVPSLSDKDVIDLINTTRTVFSPFEGTSALFGNPCLVEDVVVIVPEDEEVYLDPETYIEAINTFIDTANTNQLVLDHLLNTFKDTFKEIEDSSDDSSDSSATNIANHYTEQALGDGLPGSCEYECKDLPLTGKVICQLNCVTSCVAMCKDLSLADKAICISDCTCFLVSGPQGFGREKVEDMYRVKFCKVPVQSKRVDPGKKVFSIQAIFQEISDVLQGLKDSGQMVMFSKKKEFLDGTIKRKLVDTFAFSFQVGFKPVFSQRSKIIEERNRTQHDASLHMGILNMNVDTIDADDYDKYVVVSDVVVNKASMQPVGSIQDMAKNITAFAKAREDTQNKLIDVGQFSLLSKDFASRNTSFFVASMVDFLSDNLFFWDNTMETLFDMTEMALELQSKIENVKK